MISTYKAAYPKAPRYHWKVIPHVPAAALEETLNRLERDGWNVGAAVMGSDATFVVTATCYINEQGSEGNRTGTIEQYRAVLVAASLATDDATAALLYEASVTLWYHLPPAEQEKGRTAPLT